MEDLVIMTPARDTLDRLPPGWKEGDLLKHRFSVLMTRYQYRSRDVGIAST